MKDKATQIIGILIVIVFAVISYNVAKLVTTNVINGGNPQFTTEAKVQTVKNGFMSGCRGAKQDFLNGEQLNSFCECAWNKLYNLHGSKLIDNNELGNRILTTGYTLEETDLLVECIEPYVE